MFSRFLLIVILFFTQSFNAMAYESVRANNRIITADWIPSVNKSVTKAQATSIVYAVFSESKRHKIDPLLLLAIIKNESTFKTNARSHSGARGLMQVVPRWHRDKIRNRNIQDVSVNVEIGTMIINDCLIKHRDNVHRALTCYLGGPSKSYVNKIAKTHKELKETLTTQMFVREQPVVVVSDFHKPRQYHTLLAEMQYEQLVAALDYSTILEKQNADLTLH